MSLELDVRHLGGAHRAAAEQGVRVAAHEVTRVQTWTRDIIRDNMTLQTYSNIFWQGELLPQPPDTECGGGGVVGGVWLHHGDPQLGAGGGEVVRGGGAHDAAPHHHHVVVAAVLEVVQVSVGATGHTPHTGPGVADVGEESCHVRTPGRIRREYPQVLLMTSLFHYPF